jgi:hypothetical protein
MSLEEVLTALAAIATGFLVNRYTGAIGFRQTESPRVSRRLDYVRVTSSVAAVW